MCQQAGREGCTAHSSEHSAPVGNGVLVTGVDPCEGRRRVKHGLEAAGAVHGLVSEREGDAKHGTKLNVPFMAQHTVMVWQPTVLLSEVSQRFPAFPPHLICCPQPVQSGRETTAHRDSPKPQVKSPPVLLLSYPLPCHGAHRSRWDMARETRKEDEEGAGRQGTRPTPHLHSPRSGPAALCQHLSAGE